MRGSVKLNSGSTRSSITVANTKGTDALLYHCNAYCPVSPLILNIFRSERKRRPIMSLDKFA